MMGEHHILVVDDDRRLRDLLKRYLSQNHFHVTTTSDAIEALGLMKSMEFDLIVLDIMMPGMDGLQLTQQLRQQKITTPILLLTAKDTSQNRIEGLESGADDYLTKPFEPRELVLRVQSILKRTTLAAPATEQKTPIRVHFGQFMFDLARGELLQDGQNPVYLTTTEIELLKTLSANAHTPCSREKLVQECSIEGGERAIDVQVTRLRRKIEIDPGFPRYLQTVRGRGYVLKPEKILTD